MEKNRVMLFQVLLVILALVFMYTVRWFSESRMTEAGSFGAEGDYGNVTIADVFCSAESVSGR